MLLLPFTSHASSHPPGALPSSPSSPCASSFPGFFPSRLPANIHHDPVAGRNPITKPNTSRRQPQGRRHRLADLNVVAVVERPEVHRQELIRQRRAVGPVVDDLDQHVVVLL